MAASYKTPGVYIEEISKFPPSVAQVETAIPAFVGYTKQAVVDGHNYHTDSTIKPIKIGSLPEYEFYFGGAPKPTSIAVVLNADNTVKSAVVNGVNLLYDTVRMFYANGGGDCYIISVGGYNTAVTQVNKEKLKKGLDSLEKVDQPTLLVIPESVHLDIAEAGEIHAAMLAQCNKLQDRFAVMDLVEGDKEITPSKDPVSDFRSNVGMNYLKYGAAYYPWLKTTLQFAIDYDSVVATTSNYKKDGIAIADIKSLFNTELVASITRLDVDIAGKASLVAPTIGDATSRTVLAVTTTALYDYFKAFFEKAFTDNSATDPTSATNIHKKQVGNKSNFANLLQLLADYIHFSDADNSDAPAGDWDSPLMVPDFGGDFTGITIAAPSAGNNIYKATDTASAAAPYFKALLGKLSSLIDSFYNELKAVRANRTETLKQVDKVYKGIVDAILQQGVVLPPSGAVVGVYAAMDRDRGVWKAPANVSITAVKGPAVNITHEDQESMNVDTEAGKSVNAIRAFTGKGTLIWGARTLAGNDNEWRYVPVRRFYNMVEESVKKATAQFVFEPNDANTWVKIRAMIENFLALQWRAGALAGAKPEEAYYVRVGLGQTMTEQDILSGLMNVEIGMAVVRPAEFIVLKFSHKMQES